MGTALTAERATASLQDSLRGRDAVHARVVLDGLAQGPRRRLQNGLDHVMRVAAVVADAEGPAAQVQRHRHEGLVHRQSGAAITADARLVAQSLRQRLAETDTNV